MTQMFFSDLSSVSRTSPGFCMAISYLTLLNDGATGSAESLFLKYLEYIKKEREPVCVCLRLHRRFVKVDTGVSCSLIDAVDLSEV